MNKKYLYFLINLNVAVALSTNSAFANEGQKAQPATDVRVEQGQDALLQLDVKQVPLADVLKTLSAKTGTPIHYTVLPEGLITATCVGKALKPVLECLLDHKADVIVRYQHDTKQGAEKNAPIAEAWVLGAKLEAVAVNSACQTNPSQSEISLRQDKTVSTKPNPSDKLVDMVEAGKPADRVQAIGDLLMAGRPGDPKVKTMLEQAVHDQDPAVRAQALSTLANREDYSEHAPQLIKEALGDSSVDVRMMAVDVIKDDVALLDQASQDQDESIREYALIKMQAIQNNSKSEKISHAEYLQNQ